MAANGKDYNVWVGMSNSKMNVLRSIEVLRTVSFIIPPSWKEANQVRELSCTLLLCHRLEGHQLHGEGDGEREAVTGSSAKRSRMAN